MNPIDLRILNAYRDGDMKAHRRAAKNCALVECCQVVADKAGVRLSPEARAASSLTGGGGERGRLPATTATDEAGRVEGYQAGSYARRGAAPAAAAQPRSFQPQPVQPRQPAAPSPRPAERPAAPAAAAPPPAPPPPREEEKPAPARRGAMRFSSLSGFRRR